MYHAAIKRARRMEQRIADREEGEVLSRVIQLICLTVLSLFPALMFFQFDRVRVGTLRGQWARNIFRLDGRSG